MNKARTSRKQMSMIIDFMEKYGDIHKPRQYPAQEMIKMKWKELIKKLNSISDGHYRSEIRWGKVWSDFKNNARRKLCKIVNVSKGGPAVKFIITDLEHRALEIMQNKSPSKDEVVEIAIDGQVQEQEEGKSLSNASVPDYMNSVVKTEDCTMTSDTPETSRQSPLIEETPKPQQPTTSSQAIKDAVTQLILEADKNGRDYGRQRDRIDVDLERERIRQRDEELRLRDYELRERVRQRDVELQLQEKWLEFMKEAMHLIKRHLDK
ncbi:uncharacterized protein LOC125074682 isoform X1 [Vanessa atalanta]|uniref:uncharacterized protein LOC125074682 isoform X1 n=3 Tax=Vanessa atalanta TaxID=42275 RepID=UPI001FCE1D0E|nr:uncharacterized protein LOC125074682 isoform X1 [Vanessa atalanta]